jgi:hypothetical protein
MSGAFQGFQPFARQNSAKRAPPGFFMAQASHSAGVFLRVMKFRIIVRMGHPTKGMRIGA